MPTKKILIVDDEPDIAEILSDRLEASGFHVRIAQNARNGYAAVAEDPPNLVLMDIQMPEINGMEALVELRKTHPAIPILMVSASTTRNVAREAIASGAAGFLLKPFEPEELMRTIYGIIGHPGT